MSSDETEEKEVEPQVDFRQKQLKELEKLQMALDENNQIRGKYNALQAQVASLVDSFGPSQVSSYQSEKVYTQEEIDAMKVKLEQTLSDYREETRVASKLNSEIEKLYTELSNMRMRSRLDQDERLTRQNQTAAAGLANFRLKSAKILELAAVEKQRLTKSVDYLRDVHETSQADMREFQEQNAANQRGIEQLSSSIASAKEDIRDFTDRLQKLEPKLQEYEELKAEHQKREEQVVALSDEFEALRKQVDTESLTASVRRQIDSSNRAIADLNRTIDQILNKASLVQEKLRGARTRVADLEGKIARTKAETAELQTAKTEMIAEKKKLKRDLKQCRIAHEMIGGDNRVLMKEIQDGIAVPKAPWQIRRELLALKGDVKELTRIEAKQAKLEAALAGAIHPLTLVPLRKRVRLIPSDNKWP
jgi:chromosome segregation ATPase